MKLRKAHALAQHRKAAAVGQVHSGRQIREGDGRMSESMTGIKAGEGQDVIRRIFVGLDVDAAEVEQAARIYTRAFFERVLNGDDPQSAVFDTVITSVLIGRLAAEREGTAAS